MALQKLGLEHLPFGEGGTVHLRGPSGQVITIDSNGTKQIEWTPDDRRALEVEVRAAVIARAPLPLLPFQDVIVRAQIQIGHGKVNFTSPAIADAEQVFTYTSENWILPARGALWRLSTRELRITFQAVQMTDGSPPPAHTSIQVSIQPCSGMTRPLVPQSNYFSGQAESPVAICMFPMEANEFRVFRTDTGLPFAAGTDVLTLLSPRFGSSGPQDPANYGVFRPIPWRMIGFKINNIATTLPVPCGVEYA